MVDKDNDTKLKVELLKIIDRVLDEGHWDESDGLFLMASGKKIKELRERIKKDIDFDAPTSDNPQATIVQRIAERGGFMEVYVSLYCSDGSILKRWESIVNAIQNLGISRPIYKNEDDIRAHVRSKRNTENEAYAAAFIKQEDILEYPEDQEGKDRLGHDLLLVRENVITPDNISRFIHKSGIYLPHNGKLIRQGAVVES